MSAPNAAEATDAPTDAAKSAIQHPDYGPRIRASRILPPPEREAATIVQRIRKNLMARGLMNDSMTARLEAALDDAGLLEELAVEWMEEEEHLRMGIWPDDGHDFRRIDEADALIAFVTNTYRMDLRDRRIVTVFQQRIPPVHRRGRLGTAAKLPGKMQFLTEYDAVVTLGFLDWSLLTDRDRQRLIHHELEHLEVSDEGRLVLRGHDFEDFARVIELYGLRSEAERMSTDGRSAAALERAGSQLSLLTQ